MVLEDIIIIECFLVLIRLPTMVFQWFLGCPTIGFNGFRWSRTIGQMMEWCQWIEQVYVWVYLAFQLLVSEPCLNRHIFELASLFLEKRELFERTLDMKWCPQIGSLEAA